MNYVLVYQIQDNFQKYYRGLRAILAKCWTKSFLCFGLFFGVFASIRAQEIRFSYPVLGTLPVINFKSHDTLRYLFQQATPLVKSSPDSAIRLYLKALSWSRVIYNNRDVSKALFGLALSYETKRDFFKVAFYSKESIRLDSLCSGPSAEKYATLSQSYTMLGEYKKAIQIGHCVFSIPFSSVDSLYVATVDMGTGTAYKNMGQIDSAFFYFYKALKKWPSIDSFNAEYLCELYLGLSDITFRLKKYPQSIEYINQALLISNISKNKAIKVGLLSARGTIYYSLHDAVKAREAIQQALEYGRRMKDNELIAASAYNLAIMSFREKKYQDAMLFGQECFKVGSKSQMLSVKINASFIMGYTFFELKDYITAAGYLGPAIKEAELKNVKQNIAEAYSVMGTVCYRLKRYREAYDYKTKYNNLDRKLRSEEVAARITRVEQQYKTAEKDKYIAEQKIFLQQKESKLREKNFWIIGVGLGGLMIAAIFFVLLRNSRNKQRTALLHLQQQQEIALLKTKVNAEEVERSRIGRELHDGIVSQLLAIKLNVASIRDRDSERINANVLHNVTMQLEEAASDLRTTAHNLMPETLLQQEWKSAIEGLCRKTSRNTVMDVDLQLYGTMPSLRNDAALSLYRIIQELIQNALKHARASLLLVQLSFREGVLNITVDDNGIGIPEMVLAGYQDGMGFKILRRRIEELKGTLDINSTPGETTIYMEFEEKWLI